MLDYRLDDQGGPQPPPSEPPTKPPGWKEKDDKTKQDEPAKAS